MKKIIAFTLVLILALSCVACGNKQVDTPTEPNIVHDAAKPAEYDAKTYLVDSWREDDESGVRSYYTVLLMYSDDYYDIPNENDILYKTENGYEALLDAIDDSSITLYTLNEQTKIGVCTYAKIKTNTLIDTKKVYAMIEGPVEYDENALTEDDYKDIHGNLDGWRAIMTSVSEKTPPSNIGNDLIHMGVVNLFDNNAPQYFYSASNQDPVVDGNKMMASLVVEGLSETSTLELFLEHATLYCETANIVDGVPESVELDENLKIIGELIDGVVWLGFETVDGTDIQDSWDLVPDALVYIYNNEYYFVLK